jgi:hypothetical protein
MTDAAIRALLEAEPFEPFTVHMPHGVEYDVERPERAALSPHGGALYIYNPNGEWRAVLSLDHAVGVTFPAKPLIREGGP